MKIRSMSGFIHPFHLNRNHLIGTMVSPGVVDVEGERYLIPHSDLFIDEPVHIFLRQDRFETESQYKQRLEKDAADREAYKILQKELKIKAETVANEKLAREKATFKEFVSSYNIPFGHSVRIKPVLSGLSADSNGDGAKRNTVFHLFVEEDVAGRVNRVAGSFLCSPKDSGKWSHLDNYTYAKPVTCKKCLKLMERWLKTKN